MEGKRGRKREGEREEGGRRNAEMRRREGYQTASTAGEGGRRAVGALSIHS